VNKIILLLVAVFFMSAGCQTASYRWAKSEAGFPPDRVRTIETDSMVIRYCLVCESDGAYYFEGIARSRGAHSLGRISSGEFFLSLFQDDKLVHKVMLSRQGNSLDDAIYLRKSFNYEGSFNQAGIGWRLKYYN